MFTTNWLWQLSVVQILDSRESLWWSTWEKVTVQGVRRKHWDCFGGVVAMGNQIQHHMVATARGQPTHADHCLSAWTTSHLPVQCHQHSPESPASELKFQTRESWRITKNIQGSRKQQYKCLRIPNEQNNSQLQSWRFGHYATMLDWAYHGCYVLLLKENAPCLWPFLVQEGKCSDLLVRLSTNGHRTRR